MSEGDTMTYYTVDLYMITLHCPIRVLGFNVGVGLVCKLLVYGSSHSFIKKKPSEHSLQVSVGLVWLFVSSDGLQSVWCCTVYEMWVATGATSHTD